MTILGRDPDRHTRIMKSSKKQEKRTEDRYKGSRNDRSGAVWLRKNDVSSHEYLIENKLTENKKTITLKELDLRELRDRALLEDRVPVSKFDLAGCNYEVIGEDDFLEITTDV